MPASRVERAGGGDGCEDIRCDRCARPSAVRVTGGPRSFSVHHFFRIVYLAELNVAGGRVVAVREQSRGDGTPLAMGSVSEVCLCLSLCRCVRRVWVCVRVCVRPCVSVRVLL